MRNFTEDLLRIENFLSSECLFRIYSTGLRNGERKQTATMIRAEIQDLKSSFLIDLNKNRSWALRFCCFWQFGFPYSDITVFFRIYEVIRCEKEKYRR